MTMKKKKGEKRERKGNMTYYSTRISDGNFPPTQFRGEPQECYKRVCTCFSAPRPPPSSDSFTRLLALRAPNSLPPPTSAKTDASVTLSRREKNSGKRDKSGKVSTQINTGSNYFSGAKRARRRNSRFSVSRRMTIARVTS